MPTFWQITKRQIDRFIERRKRWRASYLTTDEAVEYMALTGRNGDLVTSRVTLQEAATRGRYGRVAAPVRCVFTSAANAHFWYVDDLEQWREWIYMAADGALGEFDIDGWDAEWKLWIPPYREMPEDEFAEHFTEETKIRRRELARRSLLSAPTVAASH